MGLLQWITRTVGRDLDRRVTGAQGEASGRYEPLADDPPLLVRARLGEGQQGTVRLRAAGAEHTGEGSVTAEVGTGAQLRGSSLSVEAEVRAAPGGALATLGVELSQGHGVQTYSVEARPDAGGRARLRLVVDLG
jgi:hypothetical protein